MNYHCHHCNAPLMRCSALNRNGELFCNITGVSVYFFGLTASDLIYKEYVYAGFHFEGLKRLLLAQKQAANKELLV